MYRRWVMSRSDNRAVGLLRTFLPTRARWKFWTIAASLSLLVPATSLVGEAQSPAQSVLAEMLGPHGDGARGCAVCHASRSAPSAVESETANAAFLWGPASNPDYGATVSLTEGTQLVDVPSTALQNGNREAKGVLLCLSCHDGNLTPNNMLQSWSYEHQVGLLQTTSFSTQKVPSLLTRDEAPVDDHPIGLAAPINPGGGLIFSEGKFSVAPNSPYAQFIASYGWPSLAQGKRSSAYGVSGTGEPYALCTTCHDQHVRNVYVSGGSNPIAGEGDGKFYKTYFFLNGPYDPTEKLAGPATTSSEQFCRQCHFDLSNEGNNNLRARTYF